MKLDIRAPDLIRRLISPLQSVTLLHLGQPKHYQTYGIQKNALSVVFQSCSASDLSEMSIIRFGDENFLAKLDEVAYNNEVDILIDDTRTDISDIETVINQVAASARHVRLVIKNAFPTASEYTEGQYKPGRPWAGKLWKLAYKFNTTFGGRTFSCEPFGVFLCDIPRAQYLRHVQGMKSVSVLGYDYDFLKNSLDPKPVTSQALIALINQSNQTERWFPVAEAPCALPTIQSRTFRHPLLSQVVYTRSSQHELRGDVVPKRHFWNPMLEETELAPSVEATFMRSGVIFGRGGAMTEEGYVLYSSLLESTHRKRPLSNAVFDVDRSRCFIDATPDILRGSQHKILVKSISSNNYGHMLVDLLPKLAALSGCADPESDLLISADLPPIVQNHISIAAKMLGYVGQVHQISDQVAYAVSNLWVVSPVSFHPKVKHPQALSILREKLRLKCGASHSKKKLGSILYVSRSQARIRRVLNEDALKARLRKFPIHHIDVSSMSLEEQIRAFGDAHLIIGPVGANLTNAMFMAPGSSTLALTPESMTDPFFKDMADCLGLRYVCQVARTEKGESQNVDFWVDPDAIVTTLERMLSS